MSLDSRPSESRYASRLKELGIRRTLVTGASGFIGRQLTATLDASGINVTAIGGSGTFDVLRDDLPLSGIDHVFHLAALTGMAEAWQRPVDYHLVNSHGTVRVLDQCRNHGCSVSYISGYVYGNAQRLPIDETAPVSANNPYAFSKLMGEEACRFYSSAFGVQTTILRLFNIYGPGQSGRFLIPHIVKQVIEDPEIRVMDLDPRRDYVFISDTIDSILVSVRASSGMAFNVGSGISYSVEDVIRIAMRQAGVEKPYRAVGQPRTNEIRDVIADTTLIRSGCGWTPCVTFEDGIGRVIQSHRAS